jgi:hypothetical protein
MLAETTRLVRLEDVEDAGATRTLSEGQTLAEELRRLPWRARPA